MIFEFFLDEKDFLTFQLFTASHSDRIKRKRRNTRLLIPLVYLVLAVVFLYQKSIDLMIIFILIGIVWYFFYPKYEKRRYIKHYQRFIKEHYEGRLENTTTLQFEKDIIIGKDEGSESKINIKEISEINEIASHIFVRLGKGQSFILPKEKIKDFSALATLLKEIAKRLNISYTIDLEWEWK